MNEDALHTLGDMALRELFDYFWVIRLLPRWIGQPVHGARGGRGGLACEIAWRNNVRIITPEPMRVELDALEVEELQVFTVDFDRLARSNREGLERWCTDAVIALCTEQDRRRAERQQEYADLAAQLADARARREVEPYAELKAWPIVGACPPDDGSV